MLVKTTKSEQVWQSGDGERTIWNVKLVDAAKKEYSLKTYSPKVAQVGFSGEVRSYLNPRGERFVRSIADSSEQPEGRGRTDDTIRAQWAIGQAVRAYGDSAVAEVATGGVEALAREFYTMVDNVKESN